MSIEWIRYAFDYSNRSVSIILISVLFSVILLTSNIYIFLYRIIIYLPTMGMLRFYAKKPKKY